MATDMLFEVRHPSNDEYLTKCPDPACAGHEIKGDSYKQLTNLAAAHARQVHNTTKVRFRNTRKRW